MRQRRAFSHLSQRLEIGALLVAVLCFQAVPVPHAPGLHQDETEVSWVDSGCRERHAASFEAGRDALSQTCVACLAHFQERSTAALAAPVATLPTLRSSLAIVTCERHGSPWSSPPPARGPPLV